MSMVALGLSWNISRRKMLTWGPGEEAAVEVCMALIRS